MAAARVIKIDVISDTVCPWCIVGKRRLDKAIEQYKINHANVDFNIAWHPFQLDPQATTRPKHDFLVSKFGEERVKNMQANMRQIGQEVGVQFSFNGVISNTLESHRIVYWSKQFGKQHQVVDEVFRDYHERGRDISDRKVLAAAAGRAGLNESEAFDYLESEKDIQFVQELANENKRNNVSGVPTYKIQDKYQFSGAQDPSTFSSYFDMVLDN